MPSCRWLAFLSWSWLGIAAIAQAAPDAVPALDAAEFRARRQALAAAVAAASGGARAVLVLRGAAKPGDMGSFAQDQDFLYLTGVDEPDGALLLVASSDGTLEHDELLVPPFSRFAARWDGRFLAPGEQAAQRTGFATVGSVRSLRRKLADLFPADPAAAPLLLTALQPAARLGSTPGKAAEAAAAIRSDPLDGRQSREEALVDRMAALLPGVEPRPLEPLVHALRARKRPAEIEQLRRVAAVTAEGIGEAMRSTRPGVYEYQLAAVARFVFALHGAGPDAYAAIVGAGPNGCILHYNRNDRRLEPDDLVVMDYAPTIAGYCSDVTRTFPASGTFSPAQRKLVLDVWEIQQELLANVRPGARLSALGNRCASLLRERGYRSEHGPCHHVGLAVHDPSVDELVAGMVITVEPGAYLDDLGMGCRIEDTVLVTEHGHEVLSAGVPSHPDAIELWMREPARFPIPLPRR